MSASSHCFGLCRYIGLLTQQTSTSFSLYQKGKGQSVTERNINTSSERSRHRPFVCGLLGCLHFVAAYTVHLARSKAARTSEFGL